MMYIVLSSIPLKNICCTKSSNGRHSKDKHKRAVHNFASIRKKVEENSVIFTMSGWSVSPVKPLKFQLHAKLLLKAKIEH